MLVYVVFERLWRCRAVLVCFWVAQVLLEVLSRGERILNEGKVELSKQNRHQ